MVSAIDLKDKRNRIKQAARRGMLELDLILQHFLEINLDNMGDTSLDKLELLLNNTDSELNDWLVLGGSLPLDPKLEDLALLIRYTAKDMIAVSDLH